MSTKKRVHNCGSSELVFTEDGRILEGFKSTDGDLEDRVTARLVANERLIVLQEAPKAPKPAKRSASKASMIQPPSTDTTEGA